MSVAEGAVTQRSLPKKNRLHLVIMLRGLDNRITGVMTVLRYGKLTAVRSDYSKYLGCFRQAVRCIYPFLYSMKIGIGFERTSYKKDRSAAVIKLSPTTLSGAGGS